MLDFLYKRLARKLMPYMCDQLQAGGHCSFCGKWVPWAITDKDWDWVICDKCRADCGGKAK